MNATLLNNYIVAMTSWKHRIHCVSETIFMMLRQTVKPQKIILTLSLSEFPNGIADLPKPLQIFKQKLPGFEIHWEEANTRAFKKVIPVIRDHKGENIYILSVDDDVYYAPQYAEYMLFLAMSHPNHYLTPGTHGPHPHGYAMIYNPSWFKDDLLWSLTPYDMKIICASDAWIWAVLQHNGIEPFVDKTIEQFIQDLDRPNKLSDEYANIRHCTMRNKYIKTLLARGITCKVY